MKNKKIAFTLMELLIVISIIGIIGVFSFGAFDKFSSEQYLKNNISSIKSEIKDFDYNVKNMKIYDYKMIFQTGSLAFITYSNYYNQDNKSMINFDNSDLSANLFFTGSYSGIGKIYYSIISEEKNLTSFSSEIKDANKYDFTGYRKTKIESSFSGKTLNDIQLNYYIYENSLKETNEASKMKLIKIQDINGNQFTSISLENFNNKKYIKDLSGNILNKIFLIFEFSGKEISLELN